MRLAAADPAERVVLERVIEAFVAELRRRLGGPFLRRELTDLYEQQGTDWCLEVAIRVAPDDSSGLGHGHGGQRRLRPLRP